MAQQNMMVRRDGWRIYYMFKQMLRIRMLAFAPSLYSVSRYCRGRSVFLESAPPHIDLCNEQVISKNVFRWVVIRDLPKDLTTD